jgi:alpha-aminoadipic semialdehyde synthase
MVSAEDLQALAKNKDFDNKLVYGCVVTAKDYLQHNGSFDMKHYLEHPQQYPPIFHEKVRIKELIDEIAPYATMIVNGIYWDNRYPRLLTSQQMEDLYKSDNCRLLSIADISCDIQGSFEFMDRATSIDHPFFMYDPISRSVQFDLVKGKGIQIMSVDILPSQLPREASEYFGNALTPFITELVTTIALYNAR